MAVDYLRIGMAADLKNPKERVLFRFFEILPGILSWLTLLAAVIFSWLKPFWVACFMFIFVLYWFFRTLYYAFHLRAGYKKTKEHEKIDWLKKIGTLRPQSSELASIKDWRDLYHLVTLVNYKEPYEVIKESFEALLKTDYPKDRMIVVLSFEERAEEERKTIARQIEEEFINDFFKLLITFHPADLEGEIPGNGSNATWAARQAQKFIDEQGIGYEKVIISSFDIDTQPLEKYFSCLAYHYLTAEKPTRTSYQPVPLYINNIWEAPAISKNFSFSASFWQIMCQERPEKLITFSSHAMSFKALVEVGFKQTNIIPDDSRIFWQCFFEYDGDYRVQPIFYPVSMDANVARNLWQTLKNIYKQQKRWAYGVGDIAYVFFAFLKNRKIPLSQKVVRGWELVEGHWSWATTSLLLFSLGWLPIVLGGADFTQSMMSYSLPKLASRIMTLAMIGIVLSIYVSMMFLPPRPPDYGKSKYFIFALSWVFLPTIMVFFSAIPALEAQTRWLFGRYMGFWVTPKTRNKTKKGPGKPDRNEV